MSWDVHFFRKDTAMIRLMQKTQRILMTITAFLLCAPVCGQTANDLEEVRRLARLAGYAHRNTKPNVPLPTSVNAAKAQTISAKLSELTIDGAESGVELYRVDQTEVEKKLGRRTPFAQKQRLLMFLDSDRKKFIVSDTFVGGRLSNSAQLFYETFFIAYAGLHSSFRTQQVPLARGVAALAALDSLYQTPYASLPAFVGETAAAMLILNADPSLIETMRRSGPQDAGLIQAVQAALQTITGDVDYAQKTAEVLLRDHNGVQAAMTPFELALLKPAGEGSFLKLRNYALYHVYHPGAIAEVLRAWAFERELTDQIIDDLGNLFDDKVLTPLKAELTTRDIKVSEAAMRAHFDTSIFVSALRLLWSIEPRIKEWCDAVHTLAGEKDAGARDAGRRALEAELHTMFYGDDLSTRMRRLNSLLATSPNGNTAQPGSPDLLFKGQTLDSNKPGWDKEQYVKAIQLVLTWNVQRLDPDGADLELVVFSGSDRSEAPEGQKTPIQEETTTQPNPVGDKPSVAPGPVSGTNPGQAVGAVGSGIGSAGGGAGGKTPTKAPPPPIESSGIAGDRPIRWKANADSEPNALNLDRYQQGLAATALLPSRRNDAADAPEDTTVWAEIVEKKQAVAEVVVHLQLSNGKTLVVGTLQKVLVKDTAKQGWKWKQADALNEGDILYGTNGAEIQIEKKEREEQEEQLTLVIPTMAVYKNLFVTGVLVEAKERVDAGGLAFDTQVEIPGDNVAKAFKLQAEDPISGFLSEHQTPVPTLVASNEMHKVETLVELRYTLDGQQRVLRVAPNQDIVVWLADRKLLTTAVALLELDDPQGGAGPEGRASTDRSHGASDVLQLKPGMQLVVNPGPSDGPPDCVALESLTAVTAKSIVPGGNEKTTIGTHILEIYNMKFVRAEGILVQVLTTYESVVGVLPNALIIQPIEGTPPGAPITWKEGEPLPQLPLQQMEDQDDPFLTTTWPAKTWLADRTTTKKATAGLRYVELVTDRGTLTCGNQQLVKAVTAQEIVECRAEEIVAAPSQWKLLFLDADRPDPKGELVPVPVKSARFSYGAQRTTFQQLVGNGLASRRTVRRGAKTVVIRKDIYFANGFLVVGLQEEAPGGGGSVSGGGQTGIAGPDPSIGESVKHVQFNLPGLGATENPLQKERVRFSEDELSIFRTNMSELNGIYSNDAKWGKVRSEKRFLRFLALYFNSASQEEFTAEESAFLKRRYGAGSKGEAPPWTQEAFLDYCQTRAVFLEHGSPADLYRLAFHYVFLLTVFYETDNIASGDSLRDDFLCITAHIALGTYQEQKARSDYYKDSQYRLGESLLWTRDATFYIRDKGKDLFGGNPVTVTPRGWEQILQDKLPLLTGTGETTQLVPRPGQVDLGNLWVQLYKYFHGAADATDLESAIFYSIVSPSQDPQEMFAVDQFTEGPYAGKSIRALLGVKTSTLSVSK
jgi:hypothetical protein